MSDPLRNIMSLSLFDTCNFRCGYCGLVESGATSQVDQLAPYRDVAFIERLARFFAAHRLGGRPWLVTLTGGEPTLMPNLALFVRLLGRQGDRVAFYSNLSVPFAKLLTLEELFYIDYVEGSYHPDWHMGERFRDSDFFGHVALLKASGVPVLVRFVGAPALLPMMPSLARWCSSLGVTFFPTTLFNHEYPRGYTDDERRTLAARTVGYSSLLQLDGGVRMGSRLCEAGSRNFAARINQGGDITPCISSDAPVLGNILENRLAPLDGPALCRREDGVCTCDIHFQQHVVQGIDDSEDFASILRGNGPHRAGDYAAWKTRLGIETNTGAWWGQGTEVIPGAELREKARNR